jgi:hypothetical protein
LVIPRYELLWIRFNLILHPLYCIEVIPALAEMAIIAIITSAMLASAGSCGTWHSCSFWQQALTLLYSIIVQLRSLNPANGCQPFIGFVKVANSLPLS